MDLIQKIIDNVIKWINKIFKFNIKVGGRK